MVKQDDTVPLAIVIDWARPQALPVTVVPAGGHFFHGQLPLLKWLVARHLSARFCKTAHQACRAVPLIFVDQPIASLKLF